MATKLTRKELVSAAEDMNRTLRLYPPIGYEGKPLTEEEVKEMSKEDFTAEVDKALKKASPKKLPESSLRAALLLENEGLVEGDDVRPNTREILKALVLEEAAAVPSPKEDKAPKTKPTKAKTANGKRKAPSNKFLVYKKWAGSQGKATADQLHAFIQEQVKLNTIKQWVNGWKKGKFLPGGVVVNHDN